MEHVNSSINNPPTREKFCLMSTVWFVLQKPITSLWRGIKAASWEKLCAELFGFNKAEIRVGQDCSILLRDPTTYDRGGRGSFYLDEKRYGPYGLLDETKTFIPEPILSHRLARITISCMRYLHRQDLKNPSNPLAAWVTKSKKLPWLWRQRIRVTSIGYRQPAGNSDVPKYSFSQSLRRSHQMLYSEGIQSEKFYQERHIFFIWALDLLYHTLRAAMKSDELTKALSKPFIPSPAYILFPLQIKRVQEAVGDYLEKVSKGAHSDLRTPNDIYLYFDSSVHRVWTPQEWSGLCVAAQNVLHSVIEFITL